MAEVTCWLFSLSPFLLTSSSLPLMCLSWHFLLHVGLYWYTMTTTQCKVRILIQDIVIILRRNVQMQISKYFSYVSVLSVVRQPTRFLCLEHPLVWLLFNKSDVVLRSKGPATPNFIQTHWLNPSSVILNVTWSLKSFFHYQSGLHYAVFLVFHGLFLLNRTYSRIIDSSPPSLFSCAHHTKDVSLNYFYKRFCGGVGFS